jgi:hypothetical protein
MWASSQFLLLFVPVASAGMFHLTSKVNKKDKAVLICMSKKYKNRTELFSILWENQIRRINKEYQTDGKLFE